MTASRAAREHSRAALTREITDVARRQLARYGAAQLSLRAVARELGLVSSALYRYFPSRDDLLTALIVEAYDDLGAHAEAADAALPAAEPRDRWRALCRAVRRWALGHPHEYALIYGSPVPDYHAPPETVTPASRVPLVLAGIVGDGWRHGCVLATTGDPALSAPLAGQADRLAAAVAPDVPGAILVRAVIVLTQLFGMTSFELFGHFVNSMDPTDAFFDHAVEVMADLLGLEPRSFRCGITE